jgi:O-methyltransferase
MRDSTKGKPFDIRFVMITRIRKLLCRVLARAESVEPRSELSDQGAEQYDLDQETRVLWNQVQSRTMTSIYRIDALRQAVEYIEANSIPGDIVECGVWRGGSMMAVGLTLLRLGARRSLWLFDTFSGMPPPGPEDKDFRGQSAAELMASQNPDTSPVWARSSLDDVKAGMIEIGYQQDLVRYVVGPVEATIPGCLPDKIALLRLDTDWFTSTYHELLHLWPRLVPNGVMIIDDYGYWAGARKAVDQYFREVGLYPFLHRIDDTGRLIIKCKQ